VSFLFFLEYTIPDLVFDCMSSMTNLRVGFWVLAYVGVDTGIIHESPSNDTNVVIASLPLNASVLFSLIPYYLMVDTILPFSLDFDEIRPHIELILEDDRRVFGQRRQNIPYCR